MPYSIDILTAQEARELAESSEEQVILHELQSISAAIQAAASRGRFFIYINDILEENYDYLRTLDYLVIYTEFGVKIDWTGGKLEKEN